MVRDIGRRRGTTLCSDFLSLAPLFATISMFFFRAISDE